MKTGVKVATTNDLPSTESPAVDETEAAPPPANPVAKVMRIALAILLSLFVYHVISDRITPYTSQAKVDTLLVQIAPEVAGVVLEVRVTDNGSVRKGQVLFRVDPEPFEIALRSAKANLAVALQGAAVSSVDIDVAQAQLHKQRVDLAASQQLGKIVTDLVAKRALAETNGIRAREDIAKTQADVTRAEADVEKARQALGEAGANNAKVRQAQAAVLQAELDLRNTTVIAPADGVVTNLRLSAGQFVNRAQPLLSFIENGPRWISADMRENQIGNLAPGNEVVVALDDNPGRVFEGRVQSIGWGVTNGGEASRPDSCRRCSPPRAGCATPSAFRFASC